MKNLWCYIVFALLFFHVLCPVCVHASPDTIGIETEGTCPLYGNDRAPARDSAIGDSMEKAVERVVGMLISQETAAENVEILNESIYPKYQNYIRDYRILHEGIDNGLYRVRVRATLSQSAIKHDLEILGILTEKWRSGDDAPTIVGVTVRGIERYRDYEALREALEKSIQGVETVHLKRMRSGVAVMDVEIRGDTSLLARELQFQKFRNFSLYVTQITRDTIEFNMAKE